MVYFPEGFPWKSKNLKELLGNEFEKADGSTVGAEALNGKITGVYFSADWCAPCKQVPITFVPVTLSLSTTVIAVMSSVHSKLPRQCA
jgi:membrane-associated PAP2 superfamily phosphatase